MNEKTKNALLSIVASLVCIGIGLLVGFIILYCINAENAVDGFTRIIKGGFYLKPKGIGSEIAQSAPLIMTGLSVAFAFKTGLFNIGAAGQYTVGVFGALYFAIILHMPWYVCLLAAMVCGAIWGAVPGIFKAYFNVNEVITSIMFNWIGLYLVNELMYNTIPGMYDQKTTRTYKLSSASPKSLIPDCGMNSIFRTSSTTIAIFIAIAIAVIIYIVLNKTTFGYELKATGFNKNAARYCGMAEKRNVILSLVISGALAGMGAALLYLTGYEQWQCSTSSVPAMGFNGIAAAFLGGLNPLGTMLASFFIQHITAGGAYVDKSLYCAQISDLISSIIIYLCGFVLFMKHVMNSSIAKREEKAALKAKAAAEQDAANGKGGDQA